MINESLQLPAEPFLFPLIFGMIITIHLKEDTYEGNNGQGTEIQGYGRFLPAAAG
jgi:hypothetical protein